VKIEDSKVREEIDVATGAILNMEKLKQTADSIKKLYSSKAYYRAKIDFRPTDLEGNLVDIEFIIEEGKKGYVKKIRFEGNKRFSARKLRKYMRTKKKGWFWWLTKRGVLDEEILNRDIQNLQAFYFDQGYIRNKIDKPKITITKDGKLIYIDIKIHEGERFKVGKIDFRGDIITTRKDLFKQVSLKEGKIYRTSVVQKDIRKITDFYGDKGYAYAEVVPIPSLDLEKRVAHITFDIRKGKEVFFERITISGNTKTRDKVIRREFKAGEGELYSATAIKRGRQKLKTSGYFKEVEFTTSRGTSDDTINVDIKVEEAPTGAFTVGAGFSSLEGMVGTASIALGGDNQRFKFGFTDPWFLGTPTTAGFNVYLEESEVFDTYSSDVVGADLTLGRYLTEYISASVTGRAERVEIFDVAPDASEEIKEEEGTKDTISLTLKLTRDTRDDFFNPTKGSKNILTLENAGGILGGDNTFYKVIGDTNWYFPLPLDTVLHLRGRSGAVEGYEGDDVPIYERFFVGGMNTIRGFEYGEAGPRDETGEVIGGENMVVLNAEVLIPLNKELGIKGALFYDGGKGWTESFGSWNHAVGFGIRWLSPIGPIRIDWGYNLDPEEDEKDSVWDFSAGYQF
jgi:outer membrane protein insertion porin family